MIRSRCDLARVAGKNKNSWTVLTTPGSLLSDFGKEKQQEKTFAPAGGERGRRDQKPNPRFYQLKIFGAIFTSTNPTIFCISYLEPAARYTENQQKTGDRKRTNALTVFNFED